MSAKWRRLIEVMQIHGVRVFLHWSVLLVGAIILLGNLKRPSDSFLVLGAYYGVIILHECGHMFAAQRMGYGVHSIELYPFWGITVYQAPSSRFDRCLITWAGVAAQAVVAIPLVIWVEVFGFTHYAPVDSILVVLGYFNLFIAAFNLLPIRPLDGATAWGLLPALFKFVRPRASRREPDWRDWE